MMKRPPFELLRVTGLRYLRDHVLWLEFSDGVRGEVDLAQALGGPLFEPLREAREFARVELGPETIEWPNGADWAPESLHTQLLEQNSWHTNENDYGDIGEADHPAGVPEISRFFGIVISMFFADHATPHFHARWGGESIAVEIDGDGIRGSFPPNRIPLVFEWRDLHRQELRTNWERLRRGELPLAIDPLE